MEDKYPFVRETKIRYRDGRKDNKIKDVRMIVYTERFKDNQHYIKFSRGENDVVLSRHTKDYGEHSGPESIERNLNDSMKAEELAWEKLMEMNMDDVKFWEDE